MVSLFSLHHSLLLHEERGRERRFYIQIAFHEDLINIFSRKGKIDWPIRKC